jgi:hypothetical protein
MGGQHRPAGGRVTASSVRKWVDAVWKKAKHFMLR